MLTIHVVFRAIHIDTMLRYISRWEVSSKDNTTNWSLKLIVSCVNLEWSPTFSHSSVFPLIFCFFFFLLYFKIIIILLFVSSLPRRSGVLAICMKNPEIIWGIQMERFIPEECFRKKVIPFEVLPFSRFYRNDRNFLYHLFGLLTMTCTKWFCEKFPVSLWKIRSVSF